MIPGLENEKTFTTGKNRGLTREQKNVFAFFKGTIHNKGGKSYSKGIRITMENVLKVRLPARLPIDISLLPILATYRLYWVIDTGFTRW